MFSVVIPTLQRSAELRPLLGLYSAHPLVDEVIVVNNASASIDAYPKVRVLDQDKNIYVNPAWNLGVAEARSDFLIISNDDISFDPALLDWIAPRVRRVGGIIGPHPSSFETPPRFRRVVPTYEAHYGFGTLMFLPRANFQTIPSDLLIWCGDDFLFGQQRRRNWSFRGWPIKTRMSTTVGSPEFEQILHADLHAYWANHTEGPFLHRFGWEARLAKLPTRVRARLSRARQEGDRPTRGGQHSGGPKSSSLT